MADGPTRAGPRCGRCSACLTVEMTKRLVLAETRLTGPGVNDATVTMWNKVLADNPCNGDPSTGDAIRRAETRHRASPRARRLWKLN